MSIYDEINEKLEDKSLNSAEIAAIGFTSGTGRFAQMDDGTRRPLSDKDYWLLDDHLEAMHQEWLRQTAAEQEATGS